MNLPTIKTRFNTEQAYRDILDRERSFVMRPRKIKRNSTSNYLENDLTTMTAGNSVNPPASKMQRSRIKTQVASKQKGASEMVPEENQSTIKRHPKSGSTKIYSQSKTLGIQHSFSTADTKLDQVMRLFEKQDMGKSRIAINKIKKSLADYERIDESRYDDAAEEFSSLPKQKSKWSIKNLSLFLQALRQINPFFNKLSDLVALCLLKVGRVRIFHKGQFVQREDHPMVEMGIILWGELVLKSKGTSMKIFNLPGDSINEELIFKSRDSKSYDKLYFKPGVQSIKQSVKAQTKGAILFMNENQYKTIFAELVKIGEKSGILTAENMMKWSYAKKKNIRKQYSHIH